jgi:diguanylate cyclase (GGDEF)-like protein
MQLYDETEHDIRDRIAAHLDAALFESVLASEVRALSVCANFARLFDLLSQFVSRVTSYRWLAVYTHRPEWLGLHTHPSARKRSEEEALRALASVPIPTDQGAAGVTTTSTMTATVVAVEDEDAHADPTGAPPILRPISLGAQIVGMVALAPRETPHPKDGELVSILARELAGPLRIAALVEESQRLATVDPLTGLMNRRAFIAGAQREVARAQRYGSPLSLLLLDIDHFKAINDRRGHPSGDAVLTAMGHLLVRSIRTVDIASRWGGEEFLVALPSTDSSGALIVAERMRAAIAEEKVKDTAGELIPVTASVGLAVYEAGEGLDSLIDRADRAMYAAKSGGRNRVSMVAAAGGAKPAPEPVAASAGPTPSIH